MAGKRALVVDDEKLIVKGIRFSLEQDDMQVDCAYDGEEDAKTSAPLSSGTVLSAPPINSTSPLPPQPQSGRHRPRQYKTAPIILFFIIVPHFQGLPLYAEYYHCNGSGGFLQAAFDLFPFKK